MRDFISIFRHYFLSMNLSDSLLDSRETPSKKIWIRSAHTTTTQHDDIRPTSVSFQTCMNKQAIPVQVQIAFVAVVQTKPNQTLDQSCVFVLITIPIPSLESKKRHCC